MLYQSEYRKRGFVEVITPNVYNTDLWEISGHLQNYRENMFIFACEDQEFAMKPMNCPGMYSLKFLYLIYNEALSDVFGFL